MSQFTPQDVQRLARLARLQLTEAETRLFARQLGEILEFAREIQAIDASAAHPAGREAPAAPLREDVVRPSLDREAVLESAPDADRAAGVFKVPRVLNG